MRVLGIDPGFKNLGLSIVELSGPSPVVVWSVNLCVGSSDSPTAFAHVLVPYLSNISKEYGFEAVASESPPIIERQVKTTALIQRAFGVIEGWAVARGLDLRLIAPRAIKREAHKVTGTEDSRDLSKAPVRDAVAQIFGEGRRTSHENDAAFAAWCCYGTPTEVKP